MTLFNVKYKIDNYLIRTVVGNVGLLLFGVFLLLSCTSHDNTEPDTPRGTAYMAITTRVQGATASINQDTQDNEDKVVNLRLMAFERATGRAVYNRVHAIDDFINYKVKVPMRTGVYDFCFVANEDAVLAEALGKVTFRDGLYYDDVLTKISYKGVNDKPGLFFMTAETSGTVTTANTQDNPLKLNIQLIRCLAKVDLNMQYKSNMTTLEKEATKGLRLTAVIFRNLPKTYSLFPPKTSYAGDLQAEDIYTGIADARYSDEGVNPVLRKSVYLPEYLRPSGASEDKQSTILVAYRKHGIDKEHTVLIEHKAWNAAGDTYKPANAAALSTKSIVRNTSYSLAATLKGWVEESITFGWEILPWTVVSSEKQFATVVVKTELKPQQGMDVQGENQNELFWHSGTPGGLKLVFNIESPAGAVWRFTITNRNDFSLEGKMMNSGVSAISGIAGSGPVELTITPLKPWSGNIRATELYLTINGVEVQIVPKMAEDGIAPGPTRRYLIEQIN